MELWKESGVKVIPVVASVAMAKRMERCKADAIVAEGTEAGGHIGENTVSYTHLVWNGKSCYKKHF